MTSSKDDVHTLAADILFRALVRLRQRHPDMTILQTLCLLQVAARPGITQRELYERLGASVSVASRTLAILSDLGARNTPAMNLVRMEVNPQDRRERLLSLSPEGRRLMEKIATDLSEMQS